MSGILKFSFWNQTILRYYTDMIQSDIYISVNVYGLTITS